MSVTSTPDDAGSETAVTTESEDSGEPAEKFIERYDSRQIKAHKENWKPEDVLELEDAVPNVLEIAIVDSLKGFDPSEEEQEAAKHFTEIQGDKLHPAHSRTLSKIAGGSR